jgi:hypothetical protein
MVTDTVDTDEMFKTNLKKPFDLMMKRDEVQEMP